MTTKKQKASRENGKLGGRPTTITARLTIHNLPNMTTEEWVRLDKWLDDTLLTIRTSNPKDSAKVARFTLYKYFISN